jgi:hypothetical protein
MVQLNGQDEEQLSQGRRAMIANAYLITVKYHPEQTVVALDLRTRVVEMARLGAAFGTRNVDYKEIQTVLLVDVKI